MSTKHTRRTFLAQAGLLGLAAAALPGSGRGAENAGKRPNVVLIVTDDQGYGDLGGHGNPALETPHLDRLHDESTRLTRFYASPVCAPTRASLMTGRWNYRTGVVDTYLGRAMMHANEVTIAEALANQGYRTGIFGKWHLGDNYPMRPQDQGFQETLVHKGGGIGQPSDPPDTGYFDPILEYNGAQKQFKGYCTDIFTDGAMDFIAADKDQPFFCYLSTNAPHTPLEIADKYADPYRKQGLHEDTARLYGMVANLDENLGRLLKHIDNLGLREDTIVVFMTDNGAQRNGQSAIDRYNAGMHGWKGSVYEGGIHVPCFMRWPGTLEPGQTVTRTAAHIDLFPTLLALCGAAPPEDVELDGRDLSPLLHDPQGDMPERNLFFQWHRGDAPEKWKACAVVGQRFKLVNGKELYDLHNDPHERHDIAAQHPAIVAEMRAAYEQWFDDVSSTRGYAPPRIYIGTKHENPVILTRQDWRGSDRAGVREGWGDKNVGHWLVDIRNAGTYRVRVDVPEDTPGTVTLRAAGVEQSKPLEKGAASVTFEGLELPAGETEVHAQLDAEGGPFGARYVVFTKE
ncbi:MAG: arylsulfatase [Candidatus Hydrogenedentota bacterium]